MSLSVRLFINLILSLNTRVDISQFIYLPIKVTLCGNNDLFMFLRLRHNNDCVCLTFVYSVLGRYVLQYTKSWLICKE